MEIISIPLKGTLAHKDSTGIEGILSTGDVQIMSAGSGISHSEYNASHFDPVNFLQIWIFPKHLNIKPRHDQKSFSPAGRANRWQIVVSPRLADGGLFINQDARLALTRLDAGMTLDYNIAFSGNGVYVFVLSGTVEIGDSTLSTRDGLSTSDSLSTRDGLGITGVDSFTVTALTSSELLAIEVPMFA
jgi:hypothetical protein